MANAQRIVAGFPFPLLVNETATKQRIAPGALINETIAAAGGATRPVKMAGTWNGYAGRSGGFAG